ncbi:hypothetical protein H4R35_004705 [Dimargaris xerosporica]|nr:hypothetical protein H4R35_004705 [Dimargaris xerosporica]
MAQNATSPTDRPSASLPRTPESGPSPASLTSPSKSPQSPNPTPSSPEPDETYLKLKAVAETNTVTESWPDLLANIETQLQKALTTKLAKATRQNSADTSVLETEAKEFQERLTATLREFYRPPFTIQRICELVTVHSRQYDAPMKFLRALEKAVLVTSTMDDFFTIANGDVRPSEPSTLVDSHAASTSSFFSSEVTNSDIPLSTESITISTEASVRTSASPEKMDYPIDAELAPAMVIESAVTADTDDSTDDLHSVASPPPTVEDDGHQAHSTPEEPSMGSTSPVLTSHTMVPGQPPPTTTPLEEDEPIIGAEIVLDGSSSPTRMDVSSDEPLSDLAMEDDEVKLEMSSPIHPKVTASPPPASPTAQPSVPEVAMEVSDDNEDLMDTDTL